MTITDERAALERLYADFAAAHLTPLWTQREGLMPQQPQPDARPALWRWSVLHPLAARSGELVPVGRGGERRAIALANPGLPGTAYATPTLWAAIQYLGPGEEAPAHRHTQTAFRFVVEGEGVWTNVEGDPVAMRRGDLLLTPGMEHAGGHGSDQLGSLRVLQVGGARLPTNWPAGSGRYSAPPCSRCSAWLKGR